MPNARRHAFTLLWVLMFTVVNVRPSLAQTSFQIEQLQIDLWPEFDRSDMLIIYRGTLPATLSLPATLTLRMPARVGQPHAVAYNDASGNLMQASYSTSVTDEWLAVTFEVPTRSFQVEFYDNLTRLGDQRSYTFVWPGDYAVAQLSIFLLPPAGATGVQTDPPFTQVDRGSGSPSYVGNFGSPEAEQEASVAISYSGTVEIVGDLVSRQTSANNNTTLMLVGVGIAVVALALGGTVWYTRRLGRQAGRDVPSQRRPAQRKKRPAKATKKTSSTSFCVQCGHSLRAGDRFCGYCGTPVKEKKTGAK